MKPKDYPEATGSGTKPEVKANVAANFAQKGARALSEGFKLRCPACHKAKMFRTYFSIKRRCDRCGVVYEREQGAFVGAIYINLIVTELLFITGYFALEYNFSLGLWTQVAIWAPFNVLFPILFFPRSKGLWTAVLYLCGDIYPDVGEN